MKTLLLILLLVPMISFGQDKETQIKELKEKYQYMYLGLVGIDYHDDFGENDCLVFNNSENKKFYFWPYLEDKEFELMDDYDEIIPKYKNKSFHVFYLTEERDIGSTETELKPVKIIYKLIP